MCGIAGVVSLRGPLNPALKNALPHMTYQLRHRGPDGEGFFSDARVAFGHRRLAIIDRVGGAQPLSNEDGSCWIVFNGEVYNHHALRKTLEDRGHTFRTHSDTEAIVHAYEEYGAACVERLEGMFAFAIYDQRRQEVFAARDRLGKKPFFYGTFGGALHFASEIKAFYASPAWDDTLDLSSLEGYLSLGYFLAPHTVYRHVRKLEPGHWLRVANGRIETRRYWDVEQFDSDGSDEPVLLDGLESALRQAVHERLESEVPLGAFLSGGVDSALVVSFMAEVLGNRLVTTSVGFGNRGHNELDAAGHTAALFDANHHAEVIEPRLDEVLDTVVGSFDEPFADSSAIPTFYVSRMARQHVAVALSGDGGDEAFAGYDFRYVPHLMECSARKLIPGAAGRSFMTALGRRWPRWQRLPRALRLRTILENLGTDAATAYYFDLCFQHPADARVLLGRRASSDLTDSATYEAVTAPYRRCPSANPVQKAQYADLHIYLPNDVLVKVDRMSMAHSLEVRSPLLDRRIVERAFAIPTRRKMPALRGKHLLRTLAQRRVSGRIASLPKHGFTAPVAEWIAGEYAERFRSDVLSSTSGASAYFDCKEISRLFEAHRRRESDRSFPLWCLWVFERWQRLRQSAAVRASSDSQASRQLSPAL